MRNAIVVACSAMVWFSISGAALAQAPRADADDAYAEAAASASSDSTCVLEYVPSDQPSTPTDRLLLRYQRIKRAGWWMTGLSAAGFVAVITGYSASCSCGEDDFLCFCGPAWGAAMGALFFGGPLVAGLVTGSIGTARFKHYEAEHPVLTRLQLGVARDRVLVGYRF